MSDGDATTRCTWLLWGGGVVTGPSVTDKHFCSKSGDALVSSGYLIVHITLDANVALNDESVTSQT